LELVVTAIALSSIKLPNRGRGRLLQLLK
jgi:hypothetical protein